MVDAKGFDEGAGVGPDGDLLCGLRIFGFMCGYWIVAASGLGGASMLAERSMAQRRCLSVAEGSDGTDARGSAGGEISGDESHGYEREHHDEKGLSVPGRSGIEK